MVLKNIEFEPQRASPTNLDLQSNDNKLRDTIIIILGFFILNYIFYLLEWPLHTFLSRHITIGSWWGHTLISDYIIDNKRQFCISCMP